MVCVFLTCLMELSSEHIETVYGEMLPLGLWAVLQLLLEWRNMGNHIAAQPLSQNRYFRYILFACLVE